MPPSLPWAWWEGFLSWKSEFDPTEREEGVRAKVCHFLSVVLISQALSRDADTTRNTEDMEHVMKSVPWAANTLCSCKGYSQQWVECSSNSWSDTASSLVIHLSNSCPSHAREKNEVFLAPWEVVDSYHQERFPDLHGIEIEAFSWRILLVINFNLFSLFPISLPHVFFFRSVSHSALFSYMPTLLICCLGTCMSRSEL